MFKMKDIDKRDLNPIKNYYLFNRKFFLEADLRILLNLIVMDLLSQVRCTTEIRLFLTFEAG
jgi:hypothetical protein